MADIPLLEMSCSVTEREPEKRTEAEGSKPRRSSSSSIIKIDSSPKTETIKKQKVKKPSRLQRLKQFRAKHLWLCWCCCCSCCCSTTQEEDDEDNEIPKAPLSEIRTWGQSFDKLMTSAAGRKFFTKFLKCEYSDENILFWLACEELKKETEKEAIEEQARIIYEDFISILSSKEVSLDSRVREIINRNMQEPTINAFDEAQVQIYTLMHRDSYPRFVNSKMYKSLAKLDTADTEPEKGIGSGSGSGTGEPSGLNKEPHG